MSATLVQLSTPRSRIVAPSRVQPPVPAEPVTVENLSLDTMLPDLFRDHPQARAVFDRYGLSGCGGPLGPIEPLGFFARTHGVDEQGLLAEVRAAMTAAPAAQAIPSGPALADTIYRRFFLGGIYLILTAGATWGAYLLWKIGFAGKFTGISIHDVNAHGHAQIYGWVGLFIMGFAYQAFPRLWHTRLAWPVLAAVAFALMAGGLVLRTVGMTMAHQWSLALPAAMAGGAMEILAVLLFAAQILFTFRRSDAKLEPYVAYAFASVGFFVLQAIVDVWHTWTTMTAADTATLLWYVATYQAPLRDLQIHGLALLMILGVSQRMLPALFGVPATPARRSWIALAILVVAVLGETVLFVAYRWTNDHALAAGLMLPWLMLAVGIAMVALPWKLHRPTPTHDRSAKFVRAAYAWLAVSMVMLLLLPVHQQLTGIKFSHAYYGAIRHAITVGFISLMIMGFAAKVVPTLNGFDTRTLSPLTGPFLLVNVGCFLRCTLQSLTDAHPAFFAVVGVSGVLEVTGLAWWGLHLASLIRRGKAQERQLESDRLATGPRPSRIDASLVVADVLAWFPHTEAVFVEHGFTLLRNPLLRRTLAKTVTIAQAASLRGVDQGHLVRSLNESIGAEVAGT